MDAHRLLFKFLLFYFAWGHFYVSLFCGGILYQYNHKITQRKSGLSEQHKTRDQLSRRRLDVSECFSVILFHICLGK